MTLDLVASAALVALIVREAMVIVEFWEDRRFAAICAGAMVGMAVALLAVWL